MIKYNVLGTSNSIHLNKDLGYIAVSYYDENFISILDYTTGKVLKNIKTNYCSASSNLLAGDNTYFIYQSEPKEIIVADAKSFSTLHTLKLDHCGAINSISLTGDNLLVTANKAIGQQKKHQNIFYFNLADKSVKAFENGKQYIKKSILFNEHIISFHNNKNTFNYLSIDTDSGESFDNEIDNGNAEYFNILKSNDGKIYVTIKLENIDNDENLVYEININNKTINKIDNVFHNLVIHSGFINNNGKSYILGFDKTIKKYTLSVTKGFSGKNGNTILGATIFTEAIAVNSEYFSFGADKVIYLVEV